MVDRDLELSEMLGRTTLDAAAVGLRLIKLIAGIDGGVTWALQNGRIDFYSPRAFCSLQPQLIIFAAR